LPFGSPASLAQLRRRLYREPLPPRALAPQTPEWLQEVILHCLEVDARERYASAADIAFDLANHSRIVPGERGRRSRRSGWTTRLRRWLQARHFEPAPCPPPTTPRGASRLVVVALTPDLKKEELLEAMRDSARALARADPQCRIACVTVVPPAATLSGEGAASSAAARHLRRLVELRAWAKPLDLPEELLTCHVLEGDRVADALIEYAALNDVDQILVGAPLGAAPCTVTVVRPPAAS
jgi:nucleotide-binding universal stress UspA family protein